jgi:hypothetical protein
MNGLEQAALREIEALHARFACWLGPGEGDLSHAEATLAPGFRMIMPDGAVRDREAVLALLRQAQGRFGSDFSIGIEEAEVLAVGDGHVLASYVERQRRTGIVNARRSGALFRADPAAPCGVVWLHLQETWIIPAS